MNVNGQSNTYIYTDGACQGNGKENAIGGWAFVCDRYDHTNGGCRKQITRYGGEAVANRQLWEKILWYLREIGINTVTFKWIKGHNGNFYNEMADKLAVKGLEELKAKKKGEQ